MITRWLVEALNSIISIRKRNQSFWINLKPLTPDCGLDFQLILSTNHGCPLGGLQVVVVRPDLKETSYNSYHAPYLRESSTPSLRLTILSFSSQARPASSQVTSAQVQGLRISCLGPFTEKTECENLISNTVRLLWRLSWASSPLNSSFLFRI